MKIKSKFLDVTLDDLTLGDAKPFDVSGTAVAGKKVFTSMPKTTGTTENMNDAATWAYLQTRKENVKGDAELLVLPILELRLGHVNGPLVVRDHHHRKVQIGVPRHGG